METNGQPTVEAITALVWRGDAVAKLTRYNEYDRRVNKHWTITVGAGTRNVTGTRRTYEAAQALAVQLLEASERWQQVQQQADETFEAMQALAAAQPEPAIQPAVIGADDKEPF